MVRCWAVQREQRPSAEEVLAELKQMTGRCCTVGAASFFRVPLLDASVALKRHAQIGLSPFWDVQLSMRTLATSVRWHKQGSSNRNPIRVSVFSFTDRNSLKRGSQRSSISVTRGSALPCWLSEEAFPNASRTMRQSRLNNIQHGRSVARFWGLV